MGQSLPRFQLVAPVTSLVESFADDVRAGLSGRPRRLSCVYFYDEEGSRAFEQICALPEYYVTRAEHQILARRAPQIARRLPPDAWIVELGSGSSTKSRLLIDAFLRAHGRLHYVPIDVSRTMLEESCHTLLAERPSLQVTAVAAEYHAALRALRAARAQRKLIVWLGSSIGNFNRRDAIAFLVHVREVMSDGDRLLIGIDLRKDRAILERAYDDSAGVTARFNKNLLRRINRELGGHFDLSRFRHRATFDEQEGCIRMDLVSTGQQRVRIDDLELELELTPGEAIHTESSYKYSFAEIDALAAAVGLTGATRWLDREGLFSLNLFAPIWQ
jgi:dimethylhistidine N-methyltransferase